LAQDSPRSSRSGSSKIGVMKRPAEDGSQEESKRRPAMPPAWNPEIAKLGVDYMYHLGISSDDCSHFTDVRLICMHGSPVRSLLFAEKVGKLLGISGPVVPVGKTERGTMCKVGPVLSLSHGMGMPSMLIFLHEVTRLLYHARVDLHEVEVVRLGSSGGVGITPGTTVITDKAFDSCLKPGWENVSLGKVERWPSQSDPGLVERLHTLAEKTGVPALVGATMATDDFFEGQGRLDGALKTWYSEEDKMKFLHRAHDQGVRNIEMEATCFLGYWARLECVAATIVCPALLDRFQGDQVTSTPAQIQGFTDNSHDLMLAYIGQKFPALIK